MLSHILYQSICYLPFAMALFLTVLVFPGVALFPSLLRTPLLATTIPIVSILIISTLAVLLYTVGYFHRAEILWATGLFGGIALVRGIVYCRKQPLAWEKNDKYLIGLNMSLLLPLVAFNGLSSFMTNDAIASWNYWALLYSQGGVPDTMGYPPFFSFLIAYCYKVLGSFELQGPIKAIFVVFPLCVLNAIAFSHREVRQHLFLYLLLISVCVFPGFLSFKFYRFYSVGYSDPMLAATVVVSVFMVLQYLQNPDNKRYLFWGMLCSVTASLSKQPGLLWACVSLPLLLIFKMIHLRKVDRWEVGAIIFLFIPASIWLLGPGSHFYDNPGVVKASTQHEHLSLAHAITTFQFSVNKYFIQQPSLFLLFVLSLCAAWRDVYKRFIWFSFILPGFLLWFVFGSYDMRLGLYLVGCAGLLIASENFLLGTAWVRRCVPSVRRVSLQAVSRGAALLGLLSFMIFSYSDQVNKHINDPYHIYPLNAGLSNLHHYFGEQADFIYSHIYTHPEVKIWAPHRLTAGMFYARTQIIPAPTNMDSADSIYENLKTYQPDYVFVPFCDRESYSDCIGMKNFLRKYPHVLVSIPLDDTGYGYRLYRFPKV